MSDDSDDPEEDMENRKRSLQNQANNFYAMLSRFKGLKGDYNFRESNGKFVETVDGMTREEIIINVQNVIGEIEKLQDDQEKLRKDFKALEEE